MTTAYLLPLLVYLPPFIAPLLMRDWLSFSVLLAFAVALAAWLVADPRFLPFWEEPLGQVIMLWGFSGLICGFAVRGLILGFGKGSAIFAAALIACGLALPPLIVFGVAEFTRMDLHGAAGAIPRASFNEGT